MLNEIEMTEVFVEYEYTELDDLQSTFSDFHKELYNFRPRYMSTEQWNSVEWLKSAISGLEAASAAIYAERESEEKRAIASFEKLIADSISIGAKDRKTAIRWILQAEDLEEDFEYDRDFVCFKLGLPYGFFKSEV